MFFNLVIEYGRRKSQPKNFSSFKSSLVMKSKRMENLKLNGKNHRHHSTLSKGIGKYRNFVCSRQLTTTIVRIITLFVMRANGMFIFGYQNVTVRKAFCKMCIFMNSRKWIRQNQFHQYLCPPQGIVLTEAFSYR